MKFELSKTDTKKLPMLEFLAIHGYGLSCQLSDYVGGNHTNNLDAIRYLRTQGWIVRPEKQHHLSLVHTNKFRFYALSQAGYDLLEDLGYPQYTRMRSSVGIPHDFGTSLVTGAIHLGARERYKSRQFFLSRSDTEATYALGKKKLRWDDLCGVDYGESEPNVRLFAVEFDRGTEPGSTRSARKSYAASIDDYAEYIGEGRYKDHLKVTSKTGMLCLYVFSKKSAERKFHEVLKRRFGDRKCGYILTQSIDGIDPFKPLKSYQHLWEGPWKRYNMEDFYICQPPM